jgi:hypothetical protein
LRLRFYLEQRLLEIIGKLKIPVPIDFAMDDCQIAPNSDPLSLPITTPSDGAMTGAAEPTQRSKPVLAGGEW